MTAAAAALGSQWSAVHVCKHCSVDALRSPVGRDGQRILLHGRCRLLLHTVRGDRAYSDGEGGCGDKAI